MQNKLDDGDNPGKIFKLILNCQKEKKICQKEEKKLLKVLIGDVKESLIRPCVKVMCTSPHKPTENQAQWSMRGLYIQ